MWRAPLVIILTAILGSALATGVVALWQGGGIRSSDEAWGMSLMLFLNATIFTIPGALLLWAVEFVFSKKVRSDRVRNTGVVVFGTIAGGIILGSLTQQGGDRPYEWALLGAIYGLATSVSFALLQQWSGRRGQRHD